MAKILVTGGAGFIGSHLTRRLVKDGHDVLVFDKKDEVEAKAKLGDIWGEFGYLHNDDYRSITDSAWNGVDTVFHLAAERSVPRGEDFPELFDTENVLKMRQLLSAAHKHGASRFVFSSSSSVYGGKDCNGVQREDMPPSPTSVYAKTKQFGEQLCQYFSRKGLAAVALRYFNVFGPHQDLDNAYAVVIPKFITEALAGKPIPVQWDGQQSRDFTFVDNVVAANICAANALKTNVSGSVYNVANGKSHTILYLAQRVIELTGSSSPIVVSGIQRPGDVYRTCGDPTQASLGMGYTAQSSFDAGLELTVKWAMQRHARGEKPF